jgi:hypothetical protein
MTIYYEQKSGGTDPFGILATVAGMATGMPWLGQAYQVGKSAVNGDWGSALLNGAKAAVGGGLLGKAGGATGGTSGLDMSTPIDYSKQLSDLNPSLVGNMTDAASAVANTAAPVAANATSMFTGALGRSPDTSYADAAKLAGTTTQYNNNITPANSLTRNLLGGSSDTSYNDVKAIDASNTAQEAADRAKMYDDKWNALTNMYGVADNSGKNLDAIKSYYQTYPVGNNQLDTQNSNGIFDALYRMYNWGR